MTLAARFPDRVGALISIDSAPVDESQQQRFGASTQGVLEFMSRLSFMNLKREKAYKHIRDHFEDN